VRSVRSIYRLLAVAGAVALLAAAAAPTALARNRSYNGPAANGVNNAGVEFGLHVRNGHPRSVFRFEFHNVPASCGGSGRTAVTSPVAGTMKVSARRRFHTTTTVNAGHLKVVIRGRFAKDFSKATGTLHVTGSAAGCSTADTGVVSWRAPRL
jgi:hypothetical protein